MGFEVWIVLLLVASGLSGGIGYAYARKGAARQSELDALAAELDEARRESAAMQSNVSEHFEQSALLFGKLASDYREFLDHFSASAQALGLSESRARDLIEQGFQPLLTHAGAEVVAEETAGAAAAGTELAVDAAAAAEDVAGQAAEDVAGQTAEDVAADTAEDVAADTADKAAAVAAVAPTGIGEVTVEMPEDTAPPDPAEAVAAAADAASAEQRAAVDESTDESTDESADESATAVTEAERQRTA